MKKLLITGIHGFVGSNLVVSLKEHCAIYGLDIVSSQKEGLIKTYPWDDMERIPPVDIVIHLAGKAHDTKKQTDAQEYFDVNTGLTKTIFDWFLESGAKKFIFFSSVKAAADNVKDEVLTEDVDPTPRGPYGKSKLAAEEYILKHMPADKLVYILRPCMIHGKGNKGNLNLLYKFVKYGIPYPLASYQNKRSLLGIDNLCFLIKELLEQNIQSGIYNIADDIPLSTDEIVEVIGIGISRKVKNLNIPKPWINLLAALGDILHMPLNSERLKKLTANYIVSNKKLLTALNCKLPISSKEGLMKTINSLGMK